MSLTYIIPGLSFQVFVSLHYFYTYCNADCEVAAQLGYMLLYCTSNTGWSIDQYHCPAGTCAVLSPDSMMMAASSELWPWSQICHLDVFMLQVSLDTAHSTDRTSTTAMTPKKKNSLSSLTCTAGSSAEQQDLLLPYNTLTEEANASPQLTPYGLRGCRKS